MLRHQIACLFGFMLLESLKNLDMLLLEDGVLMANFV